jgi:hypothetical protein
MSAKVIPRGKYKYRRHGGEPKNEAEHFFKCPKCGGLVDMRDLGQVLANEGPLPHSSEDRPQ